MIYSGGPFFAHEKVENRTKMQKKIQIKLQIPRVLYIEIIVNMN